MNLLTFEIFIKKWKGLITRCITKKKIQNVPRGYIDLENLGNT